MDDYEKQFDYNFIFHFIFALDLLLTLQYRIYYFMMISSWSLIYIF